MLQFRDGPEIVSNELGQRQRAALHIKIIPHSLFQPSLLQYRDDVLVRTTSGQEIADFYFVQICFVVSFRTNFAHIHRPYVQVYYLPSKDLQSQLSIGNKG